MGSLELLKALLGEYLAGNESVLEEINKIDITPKYNKIYIKKPFGGIRVIFAPNEEDKEILRLINKVLLNTQEVKELPQEICAFREGYSTRDAAKRHVGKDILIKIDIKDFFPSLTLRLNERYRFIPDILNKLVREFCFIDGKLAQGFPTSPVLANIFSGKVLLPKIKEYCIEQEINPEISLYADDIVLSGQNDLRKHFKPLLEIIKDLGLKINYRKSRILNKSKSQKVCGIVCNETINITKQDKKEIRGLIHKYKKFLLLGIDGQELLAKINGKLAYFNGVKQERQKKYFEMLG